MDCLRSIYRHTSRGGKGIEVQAGRHHHKSRHFDSRGLLGHSAAECTRTDPRRRDEPSDAPDPGGLHHQLRHHLSLQTQVDEQTATNASLAADIANRNDPDTVLAIAKERMRLVESGEIIFYDTTN